MCAPAPFPFSPLPWPLWLRRPACLALLTPLLLQAQPSVAVEAAQPDSPTAPLTHPSFSQQPAIAAASPSPQAWRAGNEAVSAFPRGHADIVAWEALQRALPAAATTQPPTSDGERMPPNGHPPQHGGKQ